MYTALNNIVYSYILIIISIIYALLNIHIYMISYTPIYNSVVVLVNLHEFILIYMTDIQIMECK